MDRLINENNRWHSSHFGVVGTSDAIGDSLVATLRDAPTIRTRRPSLRDGVGISFDNWSSMRTNPAYWSNWQIQGEW